MINILDIANTLTYLVAAFAVFLLGKLAFSLVKKSVQVNNVLFEDDNVPFATAMVGYYAALICILGAVIIGPSHGMIQDILDILLYGFLGIILLHISAFLNDKIIFSKFNIQKEIIKDRNQGTGFIEAGNYFATGLIVYGATIGENGNIFSVLIFWTLAQVLFFVAAKIYNLITPYNIHEEIEKDNVAVGLGYAGALIAMAILIKTGIEQDYEVWTEHVFNVLLDCGIGFIFLPFARFATDKILLPKHNLTDEIVNQSHPNVGAALIEAFAYIGGALLISWTL